MILQYFLKLLFLITQGPNYSPITQWERLTKNQVCNLFFRNLFGEGNCCFNPCTVSLGVRKCKTLITLPRPWGGLYLHEESHEDEVIYCVKQTADLCLISLKVLHSRLILNPTYCPSEIHLARHFYTVLNKNMNALVTVNNNPFILNSNLLST